MSGRRQHREERRAVTRPRQRGLLLSLLPLLLSAGCGTGPAPETAPVGTAAPGQGDLDADARAWVETTLASLSLRQKAGQMVFRWIPGGYVSTRSDEFDSLAALVDRGLGGVTISVGLPQTYVAKLNTLQRRAEVPLLVTSDFESGGPGTRLGGVYALPSLLSLGGGTQLPPTMAFGAIGEERFVRRAGRITGREARAVGVHLTFAPVADVNSDPENPIINTRSFGEDPEAVGRLAAAFVRGAHASGLLTTAKHFPGHGDTRSDSHLELPRIEADSARLDTLELEPFRRTIEAGVDAVMTAHIRVPRVLGPEAPAATFSSHFLRGILRDRLGFRGLVVTDALTMDAVTRQHADGEAAVRAARAGADVILSPFDVDAAIESIAAAVRDGRLGERVVDASVRRILRAKARAGLHRGRSVDLERVDDVVGRREHLAFADTAAVRALTLPRDRAGLVPLDTARVRRVLSVSLARPEDPAAGRAFARTLAGAGIEVESAAVLPATGAAAYDSLLARAPEFDAVLLSVYLPPKARAGSVSIPPRFEAFAARLVGRDSAGAPAAETPPTALLSFGNPYLLTAAVPAGTYLLAWGGREPGQRAAARALLGRVPVTGRLPISLPPHHARDEGLRRGPLPRSVEGEPPPGFGEGWWRGGLAEPGSRPGAGTDAVASDTAPPAPPAPPASLARADSVIRAAIADSVTPGAALVVGHRGRWLRLRGYGRLDHDPAAPAVTDSTVWDLASLTKAMGTTTALMRLVEAGRVRLDDPVARHLPGWRGTDREEVTVRQLLLHRGGFPAHRPWWMDRAGREAYREALRTEELVVPPGDSTVYSDLGYMALGLMVEEVTGEPLDRHLRRTVFGPLGMSDTGFRPDSAARPRIAPTEVDTLFRDVHVRGVVHDENAYAMGGVAGHAGLFSSARDVATFAQMLLNGGWAAPRTGPPRPPAGASGGEDTPGDVGRGAEGYGLVRVLAPATIDAFTAPDAGAERRLGWDRSPGEFSAAAFGQTGFTGTSLWIDPERELFVVLLTSRVNPTREETRHLELRRAVHRAVLEAVDAP